MCNLSDVLFLILQYISIGDIIMMVIHLMEMEIFLRTHSFPELEEGVMFILIQTRPGFLMRLHIMKIITKKETEMDTK